MTGCQREPRRVSAGLHSRRAWAWEFLRRNPAYGRDWAVIAGEMPRVKGGRGGLRLKPRWQLAMAKWGVIFRG